MKADVSSPSVLLRKTHYSRHGKVEEGQKLARKQTDGLEKGPFADIMTDITSGRALHSKNKSRPTASGRNYSLLTSAFCPVAPALALWYSSSGAPQQAHDTTSLSPPYLHTPECDMMSLSMTHQLTTSHCVPIIRTLTAANFACALALSTTPFPTQSLYL